MELGTRKTHPFEDSSPRLVLIQSQAAGQSSSPGGSEPLAGAQPPHPASHCSVEPHEKLDEEREAPKDKTETTRGCKDQLCAGVNSVLRPTSSLSPRPDGSTLITSF